MTSVTARLRIPTLVAALLWAASSVASAAPAPRIPGLFLNRADLGNEYYSGFHFSGSSGNAELKGVPGFYVAMGAGVFTTTARPICPYAYCSALQYVSSRMPPHGWGMVGGASVFTTGYFEFVGVSLFQPDQVKRSRTGSTSRIKIKQKASVALFQGYTGLASNVWIYPIPGCKGTADVRTRLGSGEQTARVKVSCKASSVEGVAGAAPGPDLETLMEALGLKSLKFDFRGDNTF